MGSITFVWFFVLLLRLQCHADKIVGMEDLITFVNHRQLSNKELNNYFIKIGIKDIYDCVDVYKQPAFEHPLLRNHTIQMKPSIWLNDVKVESTKGHEDFKHHLSKSCPEGTVPIQRNSKKDVLRAKKNANTQNKTNIDQTQSSDDGNIQVVAIINSGDNWKYYGAEARMDVYNVAVVEQDQGSSSLVMLIKGENGPQDHLNVIQFGWAVSYGLNGDLNARFFVYWTSDGFNSKGCFNLLCPGYVQLSKSFSPGMVLAPGKGVIKLAVQRDPSTLNWLLFKRDGNNNELIGYFPKEIFNNMGDASQVQIGGVVYTPENEVNFPPMGSEVQPGRGDNVCEFKEIALMNGNGEYHPPALRDARTFNLYPQFYAVNIPTNRSVEEGFVVQFGGPGGARPM